MSGHCAGGCSKADQQQQSAPAAFGGYKRITNIAHITSDGMKFIFNSLHAGFKIAQFAFSGCHGASPTCYDHQAIAAVATCAAGYTAAAATAAAPNGTIAAGTTYACVVRTATRAA